MTTDTVMLKNRNGRFLPSLFTLSLDTTGNKEQSPLNKLIHESKIAKRSAENLKAKLHMRVSKSRSRTRNSEQRPPVLLPTTLSCQKMKLSRSTMNFTPMANLVKSEISLIFGQTLESPKVSKRRNISQTDVKELKKLSQAS